MHLSVIAYIEVVNGTYSVGFISFRRFCKARFVTIVRIAGGWCVNEAYVVMFFHA